MSAAFSFDAKEQVLALDPAPRAGQTWRLFMTRGWVEVAVVAVDRTQVMVESKDGLGTYRVVVRSLDFDDALRDGLAIFLGSRKHAEVPASDH